MGKKYVEDDWFVKEIGLEACKQRDDYYEDYENRLENGKKTILENIDSLYDLIKKSVGFDVKFKDAYFENIRGEDYLRIESEDFAKDFPIIFNAWKEMTIKQGSGNFWAERNKAGYYGGEEDFSKPCKNVGYGLSVMYSYIHQGGGSNGADIGHAWTDEEHNWEWQYESSVNRAERLKREREMF